MQRDDERNLQSLRDWQHRACIDGKVSVYDLRTPLCNGARKLARVSSSQKSSGSCLFTPGLGPAQGENRVRSQIQTIAYPSQPSEQRPKPAKRHCLRKNERLGGRQEFVAIDKNIRHLHLHAPRLDPGNAPFEPQERAFPKAVTQHSEQNRSAQGENLVERQSYGQMLR
jgi:hypothetical protein